LVLDRKRRVIIHIQNKLGVSERRACTALGQARKTQRRVPHITNEEARLVERTIELATQYGRYGYRRITAMLR
jgi:putative transposase